MRGEMKYVLEIRGTVRLVGPAGRPVSIPSEEISCLQLAVQSYPTEPADYFLVGERVRIEAGPLRGISGILLRKLGKTRVAIAVNTIFRAFTVEVDPSLLSKTSVAVT
jgi:transcription antitermination factor NusG